MQVRRMDADTVSAMNTHEKLLSEFQSGEDTVLVGTQMVAKGLNLPRVTLVGVLDADMSLYTGWSRRLRRTCSNARKRLRPSATRRSRPPKP